MTHPSAAAGEARYSGRFVVVAALFVTCLIVSNIIAVKLISIGGLVLTSAELIFPISYIIGDILTEVYGFRTARRVIWLGFLCNVLAAAAILLGQHLPAAEFWTDQAAYDAILGYAPRILLASFLAYLVGEFANSYVLARMKVAMEGRHLWMRTIGSTVVGQGLDSAIFVTVAFAGILPWEVLVATALAQWLFKTGYEAAATPLTYLVVNHLKRKEGVDVYDRNTRFNPLAISD